jgi:NAD(P)-dependent dehydrogenase (short-subunit alcohol dehydrogenase family)
MGRLDGKVAIITGATSGMGAVTARRFVAEGAKVVITGRSQERGDAATSALGDNAHFIRMDIGREDEVAAMVGETVERFGRLDCLFNNAGSITYQSRIDKVVQQEFEREMAVLLGGVLFGIKYAIPAMKAQGGGSIINNASTAGHRTGHGPVLYSVAKAGVLHLTRVAAIQLAKSRIRVNSISPGCVATPIFSIGTGLTQEQAMQGLPIIERELAKITPMQIAGEPEDVASTAVFLASDESKYITAQDIAVDGGLIAGYTMDETMQKFGGMYRALSDAFPTDTA